MKTNRRIIFVLVIMCLLFLSLVVYLSYFTLVEAKNISGHPMDRRQWAYDAEVRGLIYDRNNTLLAYNDLDAKDRKIRVYPHNNLYCHIIGYNSRMYGKSQLEKQYNNLLNGKSSLAVTLNVSGTAEFGYDLVLTIDHELQQLASDLLGERSGAVVAIEPNSGAVLAMVSKPDFNPNDEILQNSWADLIENANAPLFPRATNALYAPGSTFKIVTSVAAIDDRLDYLTFNDVGKIEIEGKTFTNYGTKVMGKLDLTKAFALSSNFAFCTLGTLMKDSTLRSTAERFGFEKNMKFDLPLSKSRFPNKNMTKPDRAAAAIGQWDVQATPLQMAYVTSIIANDGLCSPPYLVAKAININGKTEYENKGVPTSRAISKESASRVKNMMVETVKTGTGQNAAIKGISVAGKTGTAENERSENNHAWFVSFAPADNPQIAVAVVLEFSGGSGGELAAPIARQIMEAWISR